MNGIHRTDCNWMHWLTSLWNYFYACDVYSIPKWCWKMFKFGQALNAGHSPSTDITSNPMRIEISEFGQWRKYLIMMLVESSCVDEGDDAVSGFSCFPKSASSRVNEIACLGWLKGSHRNSLRGRGDIGGGRLRSKGSTVDALDEWTAVVTRHDPATVSPRSG